jgi:tRNA (mo5U34)-methyltransferase
MLGTKEEAEAILKECPEWFHSIELAPGVVTPGRLSAAWFAERLADLRLPDLNGKSVLDIGAYDGYYSFAAEQRGASSVVALDHYAWFADSVPYMKEWRESWRTGTPIPAPHETRYWRPDELPGRRPFDRAREVLRSKVEPVVGDFMVMDLSTLGQFDVVLFLGILYHLEDPLSAIRRLFSVTKPGGLAIIATMAVEFPEIDIPVCEFFPGAELNNDASNWWAPNAKALEGFCTAAGFRRVEILRTRPTRPWRPVGTRVRDAFEHFIRESLPTRFGAQQRKIIPPLLYESIAHAWR